VLVVVVLLLVTRLFWRPLAPRAAAVTLFMVAFTMGPIWYPADRLAVGVAIVCAYIVAAAGVSAIAAVTLRPPWVYVICVAIGFPLVSTLAGFEYHRAVPHYYDPEVARFVERAARLEIPAGNRRSDIYYIVLDGLTREDVLQQLYGLAPPEAIGRLRSASVVVPPLARSNYTQTYLTLSSSLNGQYLDELAAVMQDDDDRRPLHRLIQRSGLVQRLKAAGYRFVMVGSDSLVAAEHQQADQCMCRFPPGLTELEFVLLQRTPLAAIGMDRPTLAAHRAAVLREFEDIESVPAGTDGAPVFVFAHVFAPHPPFVFGRDGSARLDGLYSHQDGDRFPGTPQEYVAGYSAQASFVLERATALILRLLHRRSPPVIVAVGDHGSGLRFHNDDIERTDTWERLSIFSAYFAIHPTVAVPDDMSPVNALRWAIVNATNAAVPLLPNRSYLSSYSRPYRFHEVMPNQNREPSDGMARVRPRDERPASRAD
jgi:hypothetical protein